MSNDGYSIFKRLRGVVLLGAALALVVAGVASAAIPSADGTIYACYDKQSGQARIYDPASNFPKACGPKENSVSWNVQGAPGQDGQDGQDGVDGTDGTDGVSGYERVVTLGTLDSAYDKTEYAFCPEGKNVIGGGAAVFGASSGEGQEIIYGVALVQSHPFNEDGFAARATEIVPTDSNWRVTVYAICATVN